MCLVSDRGERERYETGGPVTEMVSGEDVRGMVRDRETGRPAGQESPPEMNGVRGALARVDGPQDTIRSGREVRIERSATQTPPGAGKYGSVPWPMRNYSGSHPAWTRRSLVGGALAQVTIQVQR